VLDERSEKFLVNKWQAIVATNAERTPNLGWEKHKIMGNGKWTGDANSLIGRLRS
jgi:hypothetical protein